MGCSFCHFLLYQLLGTETFSTFLSQKAQVAMFPFIIQVSGSNVASSEVAKVAPPLCSVTVMFLALLSFRTHSVFVYLISAPPHPPPLPRLSSTKAGIWICLVHGCTPRTMAGTSWGLVTIY